MTHPRSLRRLSLVLALGLGSTWAFLSAPSPVGAQPGTRTNEGNQCMFVFRVVPDGAGVYVRATSSVSYQHALGIVNQPISISKEQFPNGFNVTIGGSVNADGVGSYCGYNVTTLDVKAPYTSFAPRGYPPHEKIANLQVIYLPDIGGGNHSDLPPIYLTPLPGFSNQIARWRLWVEQNPGSSTALALFIACSVCSIVFMGIPAYRSHRQRAEADQDWKDKLHDLKTEFDPYLGHEFGGYRLMSKLGSGGMAVVYKGVPEDTRKSEDAVAIKIMNPDVARDEEYRKRFEREIRISKDLDHPNVIRPVTWGENQGVLFFAMEYIQGTLLRDMIPERGFPFPQALEIILDICRGVVYAHNQGIVHRDLKPENVMVTQKGLVKVMDLGLAKRNESENVTKTGDTFGTPAYMSPEQITGGGALQPATDQYALGVMFFELLTGHRPFEVADSLTLVMKHLQEPPPLVRKYKPQLPQEVEALLDRMLAKDPGKRYPTMADVKTQIEKIQQTYIGTGRASLEKTPGEPKPRRDTNDLRPTRGA